MPIPVSARHGDNVSQKRPIRLGTTAPARSIISKPSMSTRMAAAGRSALPVQWVNRPHLDFRGFSGTVASGTMQPGDEIVVAGSGRQLEDRAHRHRRWR